jgi:hypothetical protein
MSKELDEEAESLGVCLDGENGCVGRFCKVLIYAGLTKRPKKQRTVIVYLHLVDRKLFVDSVELIVYVG